MNMRTRTTSLVASVMTLAMGMAGSASASEKAATCANLQANGTQQQVATLPGKPECPSTNVYNGFNDLPFVVGRKEAADAQDGEGAEQWEFLNHDNDDIPDTWEY